MKKKSKLPLMRWGIVFGLIILYSVFSSFLLPIFGPTVISFSGIPVAAAGWYFGPVGGFIVSLIAVFLNNFLMIIFGGIPWYTVDRGGFFMSAAILIMIGAGFGEIKKYSEMRLRTETQLRSRERYLSLLKMAIDSILNPENSSDRYYYLITHLINLFEADHGYFFRWDAAQEQAILVASTLPFDQPLSEIILQPGESAITESVLQTKRTLVIDNVSNSQDSFNSTLFKNLAFPVHSILSIPLIAGENKLGVVILAFNSPQHFTAEEIHYSEQSRQQLALALWTIQQEADVQQRLREADALIKITHTLGETERIGLQTVLQLIVTSAKELISSAEQAVIHLLDYEKQELTPGAVIGYENQVEGKRKMKLGEGVAGQVIATGTTINIPNIETDPNFINLGAQLPAFRSLMVAPVQSGDQKFGTISIQSSIPNSFTPKEGKLLSALGIQASIAIENAKLLESIQQALKESNALYRINQGLTSSLNPDELLQDTVDLLQKNFGYYHVQVYITDPQSQRLILRAGSGTIGEQLKHKEHSLARGEGICGYAAETGAPFFTNHVDQIVFFVRNPMLQETKSELAVPVRIGDEILGILDIQQIPPSDLTQRDIQLVSAVADQLAIAMQKANLYGKLQVSLEQEKSIRNHLLQNERLAVMGHLLATVSHELNNPLQAIQNALFLLKEEKGLSEQGKQDLEIVLGESERMASLIERLRDTYRPNSMQDFLPTQMNDMIEDVHALFSTHLRHNQIAFEFHPDPELPYIAALADQLRQVLLNLLMNAIEAMNDGGKLTVSTKLLKDTNEILITITDTGTGINPDIMPIIFDAFVTNKKRGTGMGLTITYEIVMKHRGRIQAKNNEDIGTTFNIWLPIDNKEII